MKRIAKRTIAIIAVVAVLGVTVLTLGLVKVSQDKYFFTGYDRLQVFDLSTSSAFPGVEDTVAAELDSVRFSILGALLEGQFGYSPRIIKDDDGDPVYLKATNVKSFAASADRYLLHFIYGETKSIKVDGEKYEYNRAYAFIQEGNGEIVEVRVVPYIAERVHDDSNGVDSAEFYDIADLRIKMRTSKLFVSIANAIDGVKGK